MAAVDVLILDDAESRHAELVEAALTSRGASVQRLNCSDLAAWQVQAGPGMWRMRSGSTTWEVSTGSAVWYRRLGVPDVGGFDTEEAQLVLDELPEVLLGGPDGCGVRWVDEPFRVERAERKLLQLATASRLQLQVPVSVVTNDVDAARSLLDTMRLVAKPLSAGQGIAPFVDEVTENDLDLVANLPVLVQQLITDARADLRVVVVGSQAWTWRRTRPTGLIDWRAVDPDGTGFVRIENPDVERNAVDLTSALGLSISVQDWLETPAGPVFLEANSQGAWAFLADADEIVAYEIASHLDGGSEDTLAGGSWPRPLRIVGYDLGRASKAPPNDGVVPPEYTPPQWAPLAARSPAALAVAQRANDEAREGAKAAEEKAARLVQITLATIAAGTALVAYQLGFVLERSPWFLLLLLPGAAALVCLAIAGLEAIEIDRVGHYGWPSAEHLANPGPRDPIIAMIEQEDIGRRLASWTSENKHTALMQARAWFSRGLVLLMVAIVVAIVFWGINVATPTTDTEAPVGPAITPSDPAPPRPSTP